MSCQQGCKRKGFVSQRGNLHGKQGNAKCSGEKVHINLTTQNLRHNFEVTSPKLVQLMALKLDDFPSSTW